jgi:hypothetical protein
MRRLAVVFGLALATLPASAADVIFTGIVADTCALAVPTPGIMTLSADGNTLGTDQPLGVPAEVTILSLGANLISVTPPTLESHPLAYIPGDETIEMAYNGLNGLSGIVQAFTSSAQSFAVGILPLTVLLIDNRIHDDDGFEQGTYTTKTVVTCS